MLMSAAKSLRRRMIPHHCVQHFAHVFRSSTVKTAGLTHVISETSDFFYPPAAIAFKKSPLTRIDSSHPAQLSPASVSARSQIILRTVLTGVISEGCDFFYSSNPPQFSAHHP